MTFDSTLHQSGTIQEWPSDDEGEEEEALLWLRGGSVRVFFVVLVKQGWKLQLQLKVWT